MISVIIPTFNREKTIKRAVYSVLNQTFKELEVLVVDDCSTDETTTVLDTIPDSRLKIIKLPKNEGANYARNIGIDASNGEYIAFQDSDDYWMPNKLEKQMFIMKNQNCDLVACDMISINENDNNINLIRSNNFKTSFISFNDLLYQNFISTQMVLGKREIFVKNKFDITLPRFQDWDLFLRISKYNKIYFLNEKLVIQYVQNDSITNNPSKAIKALNIIEQKWENEINANRAIKSNHYYLKGIFSSKNQEKHGGYFFKSFINRPTIKALVRLIASVLKIY